MRRPSTQAALLMSILLTFVLLVWTPLVKPVNIDPESVPVRRSLPIPSYRAHRREGVNEESVLEIVPKDAQEDPYAGHHYEASHEGDGLMGHTHASVQPAPNEEESHAARDEVIDEGDRHTHGPSQDEPPVGVVASQPVQPAHTSQGMYTLYNLDTSSEQPKSTTPFLFDPESRWAKVRKAITLWNRNFTWGSHPLPGASEFKAAPGSRWVTFFHDQAVVPMLLTDNSTILGCVVQEVIEEWEQDKAHEYLGSIMPLQPVDLPLMVHLISLCGIMHTPPPAAPQSLEPTNVWTDGLSMLQGILPGTLWCGRSDKAKVFGQLGPRAALDACCRTHDHCPAKLLPMDTRYGVTNLSLKTMSHCSCELEFYRCLKAVPSDPLAITVGQVYFNFLRLDCLTPAPTSAPSSRNNNLPGGAYSAPLEHTSIPSSKPATRTVPKFVCYRPDSNRGCRKWVPNPQAGPTLYQFTPSKLNF